MSHFDENLSKQMFAIREICELGNKIRANAKIRNRQPLRNAYVSFSDKEIQEHMIYADSGKKRLASLIEEELNVFNIEFIDEEVEARIFNYNIKPNFKILGPKGFGKAAQGLKKVFQDLSFDDRNAFLSKLKQGETITISDVPLTLADVELEMLPKDNLMSASSKTGAIVIDTTLDESLLSNGLMRDFRSLIQNLRRDAKLNITDKIYLEISCEPKRKEMLDRFLFKVKRDLLAIDIKFVSELHDACRFYFHGLVLKNASQINDTDAANISDEPFYVKMYKADK